MKRPMESLEEFRARINAAAETSDVSSASGSDSDWLLGYLAVFPGQGWWNTTRSEARHSLIVSLHVPETGVDLLTPVQLKVDALIASQIEIMS